MYMKTRGGKMVTAPNLNMSKAARDKPGKIRSIGELAAVSAQARADGRAVVLAHGVFDLLHYGHVRHLEAGRREGDLLIVTLTADRFVNKGPDRPVFPAEIRADMLAALEIVDFVGINEGPSAEPVINAIQPDVYIKGSDYARAEDDVTGKIQDECRAVEAHGGRVVFTDEIVFSASSLINRHLDVYDPALRSYLQDLREGGSYLSQLLDAVERLSKLRVLLVGDAIVDQYSYVGPLGKAWKENIITTQHHGDEVFAGGVFAAANHVAGFCAEVEVLTLLGDKDPNEELIRRSLRPNVRLTPIYRAGAPTTRKHRYVDETYLRKLFEVYYMDDTPLAGDPQGKLNALIAERARAYDLVIATDFGHGLINDPTVELLRREARFLAVNAQTNSANQGFNLVTKYPSADYICVDAPEARLAAGEKHGEIEHLLATSLAARIDCSRMIVTHGNFGCIVYERDRPIHRIPAFTRTVVDTMGAGDAFLSVTSPLVALGIPLEMVGFIGNAVGALKVGIVGHRASVDKPALIKYLTTLLK